MRVASGTRLGPYEIIALLGVGGMGEVYRARDTRLGRDVAVKVLPEHLSSSPEVRARFEREARAVSSLNHPHICVLHDVGREGETDYLVMELVEGETLAQRLGRGALPLPEVLRLGGQIADALDRAHRAGVVHRDLKPGNVMLTRSGVKLMDFGLAQLPELVGHAAQTRVTAQAAPLTREGTILGTFQYMAPEQLAGKKADARSDLWALGCVLYEMATGATAFEGQSQATLIGSIMRDEARPISERMPMAPPGLDRLVTALLAKDPEERIQTAHDAKLQLRWLAEGATSSGGSGSHVLPIAHRRHAAAWLPWAVAAAAVVLALSAVAWVTRARRSIPQRDAMQLYVAATPGARLGFEPANVAISPDGKRIAFAANEAAGVSRLWVRDLDAVTSRVLPETENATDPFWSPDSRYIAYFTSGERVQLKKVPADGGSPTVLCGASWDRGGTWGTADVIVFAPNAEGGLMRVAAAGGEATPVTTLDASRAETCHRYPSFLPDGDHFVFASLPLRAGGLDLYVGSLRSPELKKKIGTAASGATWVAPGHLLFERDSKIVVQAFDVARLELVGEAIPITDAPAPTDTDGSSVASASDDGVLAVLRSRRLPLRGKWFDRAGRPAGELSLPPDTYIKVALSPDGRSVALVRQSSRVETDIVRFDVDRGVRARLTRGHAMFGNPVWSPDGRTLAMFSNQDGREEIYTLPADGSGQPKLLPTTTDQFKGPVAWSPDGREVVFGRIATANQLDLSAVAADGGGPPRAIVAGPAGESDGRVSPDGRWLAYVSAETPREEVFLCSLADGSGKTQVSTRGGLQPRWARGGREVIYLDHDRRTFWATEILPGAPPRIGETVRLFQLPSQVQPACIDVTADGQRFLVLAAEEENPEPVVGVILDWPQLLRVR